MFAKIFKQIFDFSLAENWQIRHVFQDLLILADINGVVDMTPEAIARRTNVPLKIVKEGITELEKPDPRSRNASEAGARIVRLDKHRDWGWLIVNYDYYRKIASDEQRRERTSARVQKFRSKLVTHRNAHVTPSNLRKTLGNASNTMQSQRQRHDERACSTKRSGKALKLTPEQKDLADRIEIALGQKWINDAGKWVNRIKEVEMKPEGGFVKRPGWFAKCERVIAELENATKEGRIKTTSARYAEQIWKEFST